MTIENAILLFLLACALISFWYILYCAGPGLRKTEDEIRARIERG